MLDVVSAVRSRSLFTTIIRMRGSLRLVFAGRLMHTMAPLSVVYSDRVGDDLLIRMLKTERL